MTSQVTQILENLYEPADIDTIVSSYEHLYMLSKNKLLQLLKSEYCLFDGTLGTFRGPSVTLELLPGSTPVQCRPYPIPHSQRSTFQKELSRLMKLGVLIKNSDSPWASPSFLIPKKNGQVRFLTDLRKVNKMLVRKPYTIPKFLDVIQTLQGFTYATTLDLNMGYYAVKLDKKAQNICTIITPDGKYSYKRLPMGVKCAPDIFKKKWPL